MVDGAPPRTEPADSATGTPPPISLLEFFDFTERATRDKRETAFTAALLAEQLGYRRVWLPEHHERGVPSTNPLPLACVLGSHTSRIRVGTAVTLIRLRDPLLTAEDVATASHFCGDRLDVGLGRGDAGGRAASDLSHLRKGESETTEAIETLAATLREGREWLDPLESGYQGWLHGAGYRSADLAARLGFHYCHALFFNPDIDACRTVLRNYRAAFPSGRTAVAVTLVANDDPVTARADGTREGVRVNHAGSVRRCADTVRNVVAMTGADEVVVAELSTSPDDHLRALEQLHTVVTGRQRRDTPAGP